MGTEFAEAGAEVAQGMAIEGPQGKRIYDGRTDRGLKKEVRLGWVRSEERRAKKLRYGADWAECPSKNRIDKLPPKGTNTTQLCYGHEGFQLGAEIAIMPLGGVEEEIAEEGFSEEMAEGGLL